jgi:pimeloyl-ACP methyl ester carboxylesterase
MTDDPAGRVTSADVRRITLHGNRVTLSALYAGPKRTAPRGTIVALHGAGMSAGYFDGQANPGVSLLTLAANLGYTVVAIDRPGYGLSAEQLPSGQSVVEQAVTLRAAMRDLTARYSTGPGMLLLAHSFGGKVALTLAADDLGIELLGVDVSGCGRQHPAIGVDPVAAVRQRSKSWGPLRLYPPGTFRSSASVVNPVPARELQDVGRWQTVFDDVVGRIQVPVRFTFAEHDTWWRHDPTAVADLKARLVRAPRVVIDHQPEAGHNISLGWAARTYHLRALGFLEDCLLRQSVAVA